MYFFCVNIVLRPLIYRIPQKRPIIFITFMCAFSKIVLITKAQKGAFEDANSESVI